MTIRRLFIVTGGGGDVTVAASGVASTGVVGTFIPTTTVALTGVSSTGSVGTVTASTATIAALTGNAATGNTGSFLTQTTLALSGVSGTGSVGTLTATSGVVVALSGVDTTGAVGTVSPQISSTVALTGLAAIASVGNVLVDFTKAITGNASTGAVGNVTATSDLILALTGINATGYVGSLTASGGIGTIARPDTDNTVGAWYPSTVGQSLYSMIDEETASDTDYIYTNTNSTCTMDLSPVADPGTTSGQVISYRAWSPTGNGLTVTLKSAGTTVATWTHASLPTTVTQYDQSLSAGEVALISDYSALTIEMTST